MFEKIKMLLTSLILIIFIFFVIKICIFYMNVFKTTNQNENYISDLYNIDNQTNLQEQIDEEKIKNPKSIVLPILLYHDIRKEMTEDEKNNNAIVTTNTFTKHLEFLKQNNYTPISLDDLRNYVYLYKDLPENPVLITFDDGYYSNYEYAYKILKDYNYPAVFFAVGSMIGKDKYKSTNYDAIPHFGKEEIEEMIASNLISIQSHTYDMHQWQPYEENKTRDSMLPFISETDKEFLSSLERDVFFQQITFEENNLNPPYAIAFPNGMHNEKGDKFLKEKGYLITFTIDDDTINKITQGEHDSLYNLGRKNMTEKIKEEEILNYLKRK